MAFNLNNKIRTFAENAKTTYENGKGMIKDYSSWVSDTDGLRKNGAIPGTGASSIQINTALQQASIGSAILCGAITDTDNPTADVSELSATESKWQSAAIKLAQRLKRPPQITVKSLGSAYTGNILYTGSGSDDDEHTLYRTGLEYSPTNNTLILHDTSTSSGTPRLRIGDDAYFMDIDPSGGGEIGLYKYLESKAEPYTDEVATLITNIKGSATDYNTGSGTIKTKFDSIETRLTNLGFKSGDVSNINNVENVTLKKLGKFVVCKFTYTHSKFSFTLPSGFIPYNSFTVDAIGTNYNSTNRAVEKYAIQITVSNSGSVITTTGSLPQPCNYTVQLGWSTDSNYSI